MNEVSDSTHSTRLSRAFWLDDRPRPEANMVRSYLDRYFWFFLFLAFLIGFGCGLIAEFYIFKRDEHPAVSFGLFFLAPVLLGWLAQRPGKGALVGLVALLAVSLGHFSGAQVTEYDQNNLEYRGWLIISLFLGPFLGLAGNKIRSRRMITRSLATSVPIAWLCIPVYLWHADVLYFSDYFNPLLATFDVTVALLLLFLCRGVVARFVALLSAPVVAYPLLLATVLSSPFLWYSGGGI